MSEAIYFYHQEFELEDETARLLAGLMAPEKRISPKYFYDERGSELFTEITRQPEYYPTRTEMALLRRIRPELRRLIGPDCVLIEYGSGSSEKIRLLLETLRPRLYAPLDISKEYLARAAESIASEYPWLEVRATCTDYTREFDLPFDTRGRKVGFFPGSSIGNFSRPAASDFLARVQQKVGSDGSLLIGVDMEKDVDVLNLAYNDRAGVTAEFNRNVLRHINREFGADFEPERFDHHAEYNADEGCIQMFLVSQVDQAVSVAGETIGIAAGERIHTENSHKYGVDEFLAMATAAGFTANEFWLDDNGWFGLFYLYSQEQSGPQDGRSQSA